MKSYVVFGLVAMASGVYGAAVTDPCTSAKNQNTCESSTNPTCIWVDAAKGGECHAIYSGPGTKDQTCQAFLVEGRGKTDSTYVEVYKQGCVLGYTCAAQGDPNAGVFNQILNGTCQEELCVGKTVPKNCNGNNADDPECVSKTQRVTICHRTCSEKNPWVRITIDEDAWDGEGCGHRQHDVRDECKKYDPWTAWGVNRMDYLIKRHGLKSDHDHTYWKIWEPACPSVRANKTNSCCDWNSVDNPCCGDYSSLAFPKPSIEVKKYVGPTGHCSKDKLMDLQDDTFYTADTSSAFEYCYVITNNGPPLSSDETTSGECLRDITVSDPAEHGGTGDADGDKKADDMIVTANGVYLCPGETVYKSSGPSDGSGFPVPPTGDGPADVTVVAFGNTTGLTVTDKDPAALVVTNPAINVQKLAGPPGACTAENMENKMFEDTYYGVAGDAFVYCYKVTNGGNECLGSISIDDTATPGGSSGSVMLTIPGSTECPGFLPPSKSIYYEGPQSTIPDWPATPSVDVTASGVGQNSKATVTDKDPANVAGLKPSIEVTKFAGPPGACSGPMESSLEDDTYTVTEGDNFAYCYKITNNGPPENQGGECLGSVSITDPAPVGGTISGTTVSKVMVNVGTSLCPGQTVYQPGPTKQAPSGGEGPYDVTVEGVGENSKGSVTDTDGAKVVTNPSPTKPSIKIKKYAGLSGKCSKDMVSGLEDVTYSTTSGAEFVYCYEVTNDGDECLGYVNVTDVAPKGGVGSEVPMVNIGTTLCPGDEALYKEGPKNSAPEGLYAATVKGTGVTSGRTVTSEDTAEVVVPDSPPPPSPGCTSPMPSPGSEHCPGTDGVAIVKVLGANGGPSDADIIWGITETDGSTIKFKIKNPFPSSKRVFVEYQEPYAGHALAGPTACDEQSLGTCDTAAPEIETACLHGNSSPVSLVQVYFVDDGSDSSLIFGPGQVPDCCHPGDTPIPENAVAHYSVMIRCTCPVDM